MLYDFFLSFSSWSALLLLQDPQLSIHSWHLQWYIHWEVTLYYSDLKLNSWSALSLESLAPTCLRHHAHRPLATHLMHIAHNKNWKHFRSFEVVIWFVELYRISGRRASRSLTFCLKTKMPWHQPPPPPHFLSLILKTVVVLDIFVFYLHFFPEEGLFFVKSTYRVTLGNKMIWTPAVFVHLSTDKEMISL